MNKLQQEILKTMHNKFEETIVIDRFDASTNCIKYSKRFVYIPEITSRIVEWVNWSELYKDISKKNLDITNVNTIHFYNKCTVPRFKLKDFCTANSISSVRDSNKADIVILGPESIDTTIYTSYSTIIEPEVLYTILFTHKDILLGEFSNLDQFLSDLKSCTCKYIFNTQDYAYYAFRKIFISKGLIKISEQLQGFIVARFSITNDPSFVDKLIDPNNNFYGQDSILRLLNIGAIINKEVSDQISALIDSEDKQNVVVAMEIMANCNYEESIIYLCLLFRNYYGTKFRSVKENNAVNFKSLKKYLGLNLYHITLDNIVNVCINKDLLTQSNIDILQSIAFAEAQESANTKYFWITKVDFVKEAIEEEVEV